MLLNNCETDTLMNFVSFFYLKFYGMKNLFLIKFAVQIFFSIPSLNFVETDGLSLTSCLSRPPF